ARTREEIDRKGFRGLAVQVDGGIDEDTGATAARAGADVFVAGSAVFGHDRPDQAAHRLRLAVSLAGGRPLAEEPPLAAGDGAERTAGERTAGEGASEEPGAGSRSRDR
ncbi:MAG: ribulose-phosphate 3-epimerase, partial [Acidimicrobiales bacterium]